MKDTRVKIFPTVAALLLAASAFEQTRVKVYVFTAPPVGGLVDEAVKARMTSLAEVQKALAKTNAVTLVANKADATRAGGTRQRGDRGR
jgi:hypothetical protein